MQRSRSLAKPSALLLSTALALVACQPGQVPGMATKAKHFHTALCHVDDPDCGGGGGGGVGGWEPIEEFPIDDPTVYPTAAPTAIHTIAPTAFPIFDPTPLPTIAPTAMATLAPLPIDMSVRPTRGTGVVTLAGSTANLAGFADGSGTSSLFSRPMGMAADAAGNIYVADTFNHRIRKITPAGVVSTLAGGTGKGFADGVGSMAKFNFPHGVAVTSDGTVYVADTSNNRIRKITPAGTVSTLAGSSTSGSLDGLGVSAQFRSPWDIVADAAGNLYVTESLNPGIRRISSSGNVTTYVTNLNDSRGLTIDRDGNLYVAEPSIGQITKVNAFGVPSPHLTGLDQPWDVAVDGSGNLVVSEANDVSSNYKLKLINPSGAVSLLTGGGLGDTDGGLGSALFTSPKSVVIANGHAYTSEYGNNRVRQVSFGSYLTNTWEAQEPTLGSFTWVDFAGDYAAKEAGPAPDGMSDGHFKVQITTPITAAVTSMQITQDDSSGHIWDITTGNTVWNLAVRYGSIPMNSASQGPFNLNAGTTTLDLFAGSTARCAGNKFFDVNAYYTLTMVVGGKTLTRTIAVNNADACTVSSTPGPLIPAMSSNTSPSGIATASGENWPASYAFDGTDATQWGSAINAGVPAWIAYEFPSAKTVTSYNLSFVNGSLWQRGPKNWTLQGWNGSSWVTVDTVNGETCWGNPAGSASSACGALNNQRTYTVDTPGSYIKYRLYVTRDNYETATPTMVTLGTFQLNGY
jgi:sugar lactone lactonase YvrE